MSDAEIVDSVFLRFGASPPRIFLDGADVETVLAVEKKYPGLVKGYTTNPTLMRAAGVTDYAAFAADMLYAAGGRPVSFEVLADDEDEMVRQARVIAAWGSGSELDDVYVKIPVTFTSGESTGPVIRTLVQEGAHVNVTAVFTVAQVQRVANDLAGYSELGIVSVFAGRVANAGHHPVAHVAQCRAVLQHLGSRADVLWASPRQVYDVVAARSAGADIITLTPALIDQLHLIGKSLTGYSRETVQMFRDDALAAGYEI